MNADEVEIPDFSKMPDLELLEEYFSSDAFTDIEARSSAYNQALGNEVYKRHPEMFTTEQDIDEIDDQLI